MMSISPRLSIADEFGLDSFAAVHGAGLNSTVAVIAAILGGVAGPEAWLETELGPVILPRLNLILSSEDLPLGLMVDRLIHPMDQLNRRIAENMTRFDPTMISQMVSGARPGTIAFKRLEQSMTDVMWSRHRESLQVGSGSDDLVTASDSEFDPLVARKEAMLHPRFLFQDSPLEDLASRVGDCHLRTALLVFPRVEHVPGEIEPRSFLSFLDLASGRVDVLDGAGRDSYLRLNLRAILSLSPAALDAVTGLAPGFGSTFLFVPKSPDETPGSEVREQRQKAFRFLEFFRSALATIIQTRRAGLALVGDLSTDAALDSYHRHDRLYRQEIGKFPLSSQALLRGLPQAILWTMLQLRASSGGNDRGGELGIVSFSFKIARELANGHRSRVRAHTFSGVLSQRRELALKIVGKIDSSGPLSMRDILQSTHKKKAGIEPLLLVLVGAGVLELTENQGYRLGTVSVDDVLDDLDFSGDLQE